MDWALGEKRSGEGSVKDEYEIRKEGSKVTG